MNKVQNIIFFLPDYLGDDFHDTKNGVKLLGVYLDDKLIFDLHDDYKCGRLREGVNLLSQELERSC